MKIDRLDWALPFKVVEMLKNHFVIVDQNNQPYDRFFYQDLKVATKQAKAKTEYVKQMLAER